MKHIGALGRGAEKGGHGRGSDPGRAGARGGPDGRCGGGQGPAAGHYGRAGAAGGTPFFAASLRITSATAGRS